MVARLLARLHLGRCHADGASSSLAVFFCFVRSLNILPHFFSRFLPSSSRLASSVYLSVFLLFNTSLSISYSYSSSSPRQVIDLAAAAFGFFGLVYAGSGVFAVVNSASLAVTAVLSRVLLKRPLSRAKMIAVGVVSGGLALAGASVHFLCVFPRFRLVMGRRWWVAVVVVALAVGW